MAHRVTSGEFVRNVGYWLNEALLEPVDITHLGKVRLRLAIPDQSVAILDGTVDELAT